MSAADPTRPVFDGLFSDAVPALLGGRHRQDVPPVDGGRWYASVVHFAAPVLDAPGLVAWAEQRRQSLTHDLVLDSLTLTRFRYCANGRRRHMVMEPWHSVDLAGG